MVRYPIWITLWRIFFGDMFPRYIRIIWCSTLMRSVSLLSRMEIFWTVQVTQFVSAKSRIEHHLGELIRVFYSKLIGYLLCFCVVYLNTVHFHRLESPIRRLAVSASLWWIKAASWNGQGMCVRKRSFCARLDACYCLFLLIFRFYFAFPGPERAESR